jgi:hypothetical protein
MYCGEGRCRAEGLRRGTILVALGGTESRLMKIGLLVKDLRSPGMLRGVGWWFAIDVSG